MFNISNDVLLWNRILIGKQIHNLIFFFLYYLFKLNLNYILHIRIKYFNKKVNDKNSINIFDKMYNFNLI